MSANAATWLCDTTAATSPHGCPPTTSATGLGYAITIHAAQGVTADTMHGLITDKNLGSSCIRCTRGRVANHLYLQVVGDGDPHLIRPDTVAPRTPTETLQQILARDEAPASASSSSGDSATQPRSCSTPSSATPTGSRWHPSSFVDPQISHTLDDQADNIVPSAHQRAVVANPQSTPARVGG